MGLKKLLEDEIFNLPLEQPKDENFKTFINKKLNIFLDMVNSLSGRYIDQEKQIPLSFIKKTQKKNIDNLIKSIDAYYNGNPFMAYEKFNLVLKNDLKDLYSIIKNKEYNVNESFFRIRLNDKNFPYNRKELFHIPFELRNKVKTQRFSIPGFPSLYLGRTVYVCWEELNRPTIDKIQAVRFKNIQPLKLLDLTPPSRNSNNIDDLYRFFMTFPLIMCCSVKVKDYSDSFKPEYIIPQLLLQWIRNNDILDGIQYKSTHISSKVYNENSELINIVLPVKTNHDNGLCQELVSFFESTDVITWNLLQFAIEGNNFLPSYDDRIILDKRIPNLEILEGKKYPYSYSTLGKLEYHLEISQTKLIE